MALEDKDCSPWLILAGSTSAGGCMHVYRDMVKFGMIDAIVATGASIVDMDFFEALGFKHYQAAGHGRRQRAARQLHRPHLRHLYRRGRAPELRPHDPARSPTAWSRAPIPAASSSARWASGWPKATPRSPARLIQTAYEEGVPIFCPAFVDSSAGFGLVKHQKERIAGGQALPDASTRSPTSAN